MTTVLIVAALLIGLPSQACTPSTLLDDQLSALLAYGSPGKPIVALNAWLDHLALEPYFYLGDDGLAGIEVVLAVHVGSRVLMQGVEVSLTLDGLICSITPEPSARFEVQWVSSRQLRQLRRGMAFESVVTRLCPPSSMLPHPNGGFIAAYGLPEPSGQDSSGFVNLYFNSASRLVRKEIYYR